jgi:hypothetical protein
VSSHGTHSQDAQENPDFPAQPGNGAEASDVPEPSLKLPAEITLLTLLL